MHIRKSNWKIILIWRREEEKTQGRSSARIWCAVPVVPCTHDEMRGEERKKKKRKMSTMQPFLKVSQFPTHFHSRFFHRFFSVVIRTYNKFLIFNWKYSQITVNYRRHSISQWLQFIGNFKNCNCNLLLLALFWPGNGVFHFAQKIALAIATWLTHSLKLSEISILDASNSRKFAQSSILPDVCSVCAVRHWTFCAFVRVLLSHTTFVSSNYKKIS